MLTEIAVRNLKPKPARYEIPDGNGLYVVVQPSGRKSYAVRFRVNGQPKKLTLVPGLTLAEARAEAAAAVVKVQRGADPTAAKRKAKEAQQAAAANTFKAVAESYLKREGGKLRSLDWQRRLLERLVYPEIGGVPIGALKRKAIVALLDKVEDGSGATMAHSTLAVVRRIMGWHATRDEDYASPIVRGMGRIRPNERARKRILTDDELRTIWKTAEERADPFAAFVRFLLLTAARRDEARELTWGEIEGEAWTLPAGRNKTKLDLVRPLSKTALAWIEAQPRINDCAFVFTVTGNKAISSLSRYKRDLDLAAGVRGWTLHDLRRTARSLMSRAGVNADHAERCLGHVIGGVRGTYGRHEYLAEKRHAFEALAALIERIVNPPAANVAPLRGARP
jgi:integrase